jgi:hypothetical protein
MPMQRRGTISRFNRAVCDALHSDGSPKLTGFVVHERPTECPLVAFGVFHCGAQNFHAIGGTADIDWPPAPIASEAYDPKRSLADAGAHSHIGHYGISSR